MSLHLRWVSSSLGPTGPFPVICWLWFLISESWYEQVCFTLNNFARSRNFFWKHSWERCHTQILKLQGCGMTDEMNVVLFWETSGLGFSQCHSSIMCCAAATSWKFSETPSVDSSWACFVFSTLDFSSFFFLFVFWSHIKALALCLPHSLFCAIIYKILLQAVGTIMSATSLQRFLPGSGPVLLDLGTAR